MNTKNSIWQDAVNAALGTEIISLTQLAGGDFAQAFRATLANGSTVFIKTHSQPPPGFFSTEAAGLCWLRESGQVAVPEVLSCSDDPPYLALEWIETQQAQGSQLGEERFGQSLAGLHQAGSGTFGRSDQRTTGSLALPNTPCETWAEFYASCRLYPLAGKAAERGVFSSRVLDNIESVASKLTEFGAADEKPALLHGDLWAGNRIIDTQDQSWLIDPAAHGGHREFDLAMMRLFGGFDDRCFSAYHERYPLEDEWQDRVALHQLAPLIVHAIKFGAHYVSAAEEALRHYS